MLSKYIQSVKNLESAYLYYLHYSVIAVPGLGSHAIGSWKSPSNNDLWLRDYLPDDVPNIRILLYGYHTSLLGNDYKDSIENLGSRFLESIKAFRADNVCGIKSPRAIWLTLWQADRRPIVFIGHSLGGLLVKEVRLFIYLESHETCSYSIVGLSSCAQ